MLPKVTIGDGYTNLVYWFYRWKIQWWVMVTYVVDISYLDTNEGIVVNF